MTAHTEIFIQGEPFVLLPQKAVFRPEFKQLILGDLHLGKTTHFRKQGIPLPPQSYLRDLDTLHYLLDTWQPRLVILLGDVFHSDYNREWLWFKSLLTTYPHIRFILVEGNHDILSPELYDIPNLLKLAYIEESTLIFTHRPVEQPAKLNICGHIHPGIQLTGYARQSVKLPCFYKSRTHFVLPAFGNLTGLKLLEQERDAEYYLVSGNRIIKL